MFPFALRSILENLPKILASHQRQERQRRFIEHGWTLFAMPIVKRKAYPQPRPLVDLDLIVTHVTDVRGGFGVSKRAVSRWVKTLRGDAPNVLRSTGYAGTDAELVSAGVWSPRVMGGFEFPGSLSPETELHALASRLALWERYRGTVPYHQIGAANGDNIANRELSHMTWHGSLGNDGVGWALDVGRSQALDNWHIDTGRASLTTLYHRVMAVSAKARADGIRIAPHRAFSGRRLADTGPAVHREIVLPCVRELDGLRVDYEAQRGTGRPVPRAWDDDALYDSKGRRLT